MAGGEQLSEWLSLNLHEVPLEHHPLVDRMDRTAGCDLPLAGADRSRDPSDLEPVRLSFDDPSSQLDERCFEEGSDEPWLQLSGFGPFDLITDLLDADPIQQVGAESSLIDDLLETGDDLPIDHLLKMKSRFGSLAETDRLDQQLPEGAVDDGVSQHVVHLVAEHAALLFYLGEEPVEHLPFPGVDGDQVPQM